MTVTRSMRNNYVTMSTIVAKAAATPRRQPKKKKYSQAVRRTISLPPDLNQEAESLARKYRFSTFSDYVQGHMRNDMGIVLPTLQITE